MLDKIYFVSICPARLIPSHKSFAHLPWKMVPWDYNYCGIVLNHLESAPVQILNFAV